MASSANKISRQVQDSARPAQARGRPIPQFGPGGL